MWILEQDPKDYRTCTESRLEGHKVQKVKRGKQGNQQDGEMKNKIQNYLLCQVKHILWAEPWGEGSETEAKLGKCSEASGGKWVQNQTRFS